MISGKQAAAIALTIIIAIPILMGYAFASEPVTRTQYNVDESVSLSDRLLNDDAYYYRDYSGPENNGRLLEGNGTDIYDFVAPDYVKSGSGVASSVPVGTSTSGTFALTANQYNSLSGIPYSAYTFDTTGESSTAIRLTYADGSTEELAGVGIGVECIRFGSTFAWKEGGFNPMYTYSFVADVELNLGNTTSLTYYYYAPTGDYADPSYGWTIPDLTNWYNWSNGYVNHSATFYMSIPTPGSGFTTTAIFGPHDGVYGANYDIVFTLTSSGWLTFTYRNTTYTLGEYNDVQIVYTVDGDCSVSGVVGWPTMGGEPSLLKTVTFPCAHSSDFTMVYLKYGGDTVPIWRCDSAEIVAGSFPATKNYKLNLPNLYPGETAYNLKLNSIGIYGDSLTIGGTTYAVTDGKITVNNKEIPLKGAVMRMVYLGQTWIVTFNDATSIQIVGTPSVKFDGTWALTATAELLSTETVTTEEWAPGQFAFDKDSFILMIIFCAAAAFVALGFTAGRSGGKVLALAVACGGAAVIALILV